PKWLSTLRSSIAGIYAWRMGIDSSGGAVPAEYLPKTEAERQRMAREADFADRQAFALAPDSPKAVYRYVNFLVNEKPMRIADAIAVAQVACDIHEGDAVSDQFHNLLKTLHDVQNQESKGP